jgi:hypothetical protein
MVGLVETNPLLAQKQKLRLRWLGVLLIELRDYITFRSYFQSVFWPSQLSCGAEHSEVETSALVAATVFFLAGSTN